jgi:D-glycero-D-manno-heptose 1,7-bisphosphate phosphatase
VGGLRRAAAFLDRDGTLNVRPAEHRWITSPAQFSWLWGAPEAAAALARAGYVLTVVSNQRGISTGAVSRATLRAVEELIQRRLAEHGCEITAFEYCPHSPEAGCDCRKPRPAMITKLARDLDLDVERSWVIGDSPADVMAGRAARCRTALIGEIAADCAPDITAPSLNAAVALVLRETNAVHPPDSVRPASNSFTSAW